MVSTNEKRSSLKRTQQDYSLAFKLQVVDEIEKGHLTYKQSQKKYGIQGRSTVLVWLRKHGTLDWTSKVPMKKKAPQIKSWWGWGTSQIYDNTPYIPSFLLIVRQ